MEFVDKKLSEITPYKNNPRNNDEAVGPVAESIKEFGFKVPIVVDKNGEIVNGHTRYKAAKKLGLETVPVIVADDLSDEQIKAFRLADNKVGEIAVWDLDLLNEELNDILDLDMSAFGFDVLDNLDDLIEDEKDLDDFTENVPDEPKSKLGDIYQLGSHKLMCGDSTSAADVKKLMNGELADLLLTDPPYNVSYEGKTKDSLTIKNDSMDNDSFRQFLVNAFSSANEVMKPGAVFYIWHADSEGYNFRGACFDIGWTVRQCLIWNKNSMVLGRQDYHWKHEPCLYGWKDGAGHLWASDRKQTTVIDYEKPQRNGVHPTMKPVGLFDYQIKNNTKGSDIVLDLFGGSGTTLIACESNGRHARLMEYDPKYVDVIINRWEELTGDKAIKLN
ncbi:DNA modification methylase [Streptococcus phage Javan117]|uniref:DNA modification methylase n=1 Tax=Streptococcus dysgalactiae TaxID=1334 RepID=UPI0008246934|nr:DNA modification methylase [Streptococcus dysgalactiae]OCW99281.1 lactate dehydrogenase [Streptococcus dysgalactiae subsp. equisimilis]QBX14016.1 DNA modification methylase [Streptococcus phage Javan117]